MSEQSVFFLLTLKSVLKLATEPLEDVNALFLFFFFFFFKRWDAAMLAINTAPFLRPRLNLCYVKLQTFHLSKRQ